MIQFTREYKDSSIAKTEMAKMAKRGYRVVSMTNVDQSAGVGRWLMIGVAALIFKPKPHVLVAYEGETAPIEAPKTVKSWADVKAIWSAAYNERRG